MTGKVLILVAFYTGQRLGDGTNLRWRDIDLHNGQFAGRSSKTKPLLMYR